MEKPEIKKEIKKIGIISAEKRILLFRRGIRFYAYPRKRKIMPVCS